MAGGKNITTDHLPALVGRIKRYVDRKGCTSVEFLTSSVTGVSASDERINCLVSFDDSSDSGLIQEALNDRGEACVNLTLKDEDGDLFFTQPVTFVREFYNENPQQDDSHRLIGRTVFYSPAGVAHRCDITLDQSDANDSGTGYSYAECEADIYPLPLVAPFFHIEAVADGAAPTDDLLNAAVLRIPGAKKLLAQGYVPYLLRNIRKSSCRGKKRINGEMVSLPGRKKHIGWRKGWQVYRNDSFLQVEDDDSISFRYNNDGALNKDDSRNIWGSVPLILLNYVEKETGKAVILKRGGDFGRNIFFHGYGPVLYKAPTDEAAHKFSNGKVRLGIVFSPRQNLKKDRFDFGKCVTNIAEFTLCGSWHKVETATKEFYMHLRLSFGKPV